MTLANVAMFAVVDVLSFRRSRLLSRYPIWRSVMIGAVAGIFWVLWAIVSWVNRAQIAREWDMYRAEESSRT